MTEAGTIDGHQRAAAVRVSDRGAKRVYTRRIRTVQAAIALVFGTIAAITLIGAFANGAGAVGVVTGVIVFAGCLVLFVGVLRRAIVVTPGWVTVRGLLTTRRIPASAIAHFEPPGPYGGLRGTGLRIVLADGTTRTCAAFSNTPIDMTPAGVAESAELNVWLALHGSTSPSAGRLPDRVQEAGWRVAAWYIWLVALALLALMCVVVVLAVASDPTFGGA